MKRIGFFALLLALVLTACVPAFKPSESPADGAVLSAAAVSMGTLYRVEVSPKVDTLVLIFYGEDLAVNASECSGTSVDVTCIVRDVQNFYEVTVAGVVKNLPEELYGLVCREGIPCQHLYLSQ